MLRGDFRVLEGPKKGSKIVYNPVSDFNKALFYKGFLEFLNPQNASRDASRYRHVRVTVSLDTR